MRQTLTGSTENTAGVRVELENQTARIGLDVEIEYGVGARELVRALRRHVPKAVEEIAGVTVVELNVVITDVHLPGGDDARRRRDAASAARRDAVAAPAPGGRARLRRWSWQHRASTGPVRRARATTRGGHRWRPCS